MPNLLDSFSGTTYFQNIPFFLDIMRAEDYIKIQVRSANMVYAQKDFFRFGFLCYFEPILTRQMHGRIIPARISGYVDYENDRF